MATPVVDRVSVEIVQANILWGFLGGIIGLFAGWLGLFGVIIGVIALVLSWLWLKTSARIKMLLFGFGLVATMVGVVMMMASSVTASLGLTPDETKGLGFFAIPTYLSQLVNSKMGVFSALLNVSEGVPTATGLSALSRLLGGTTSTTSTGGGSTVA